MSLAQNLQDSSAYAGQTCPQKHLSVTAEIQEPPSQLKARPARRSPPPHMRRARLLQLVFSGS